MKQVLKTATSARSWVVIYSDGPFGSREMRNLSKMLDLMIEWFTEDEIPADDYDFWVNQNA